MGTLAVGSFGLTILGFCGKKEYKCNENRGRNYLPNFNKTLGDLLAPRSEDFLSSTERSMSSTLINLPVINANIKSITFDA